VNAALATPNTTSTTWSYNFDPGVNGSFTASAAAIDAGNNLDTSPGTSDFTIDAPPVPDTVAPNGTVTVPTANQVFPNDQITFSGDATDNVVVPSVQLAIRNRTTGQWFNGTGWQASFIWFTNATLTSPGSAATGWNYTWAPPAGSGSYLIQARANDAAANFDQTRPSVNFSVTG
jgi:hypothetical protein